MSQIVTSQAPLLIVDVSQFQGPAIDWPAVAASGIAGCYLRAFEGQTPDPTFARNRKEALAAGLFVGAYQYLRARHPPRYLAGLLLGALGELGPRELPPAIDCEDLDEHPAVEVRAAIVAWREHVRGQIRREPVVYTGPGWWLGQLRGHTLADVAAAPLWVADYRPGAPQIPAPWKGCAMHQYTGSATVPGIPGACDLSRWQGDQGNLAAFAMGSPPDPPGWPTSATDTDPIDTTAGAPGE